MNFSQAESYLLSLGNEVVTMKLGLTNIRTLLAALGDPQNKYLKVQVAGTNGKGSVCAFLASICVSAGVKTGLFTSPHLISITERIRINEVEISEIDFACHATHVRETAEQLLASGELEYRPTFFEQVTAIALTTFAEAKVELAILETGLGGRLDATTAANAEIAAITRIDLDHQEYLGYTLAEIAVEKAAIIHKGSAVVVSEQKTEAKKVINDRLVNLGITARQATQVSTSCGSGWLKFDTEQAAYSIEQPGLKGRHQIENAKVAILLAEILQNHFPVSTQNIVDGLQNARHPGRLEYNGRYLFDGAHNLGGVKALREYLDEFVTNPITMIFGAMSDKNVGEIAEILFPKAENIILTRPDNSRALTAEDIAASAGEHVDTDHCFLTKTVSEAIEKSNEVSRDDSLILVTGSLYLVGEVKKLLTQKSEFEI